MEFITIIGLFILGSCIASFMGVLIERLPEEKPVLFDRSRCDYCKKVLPWYALFPILSFLFGKGRTYCCQKKLSLFYLLFELGIGILFVALYVITPIWSVYWYTLFIVCGLIVITFTDIQKGIVPLVIVLLMSVVSIFFNYLYYPSLLPYLLGMSISMLLFGGIILATKGRGMGLGDLWLAMFMGLFLGYPKTLLALYLAFLTGAIVSLILIIAKKKKFKGETVPFGPFLVLGTFLAHFYGTKILSFLLPFIT